MTKKFNLEEYKETLKIPKLLEKPAKYVILNEELQACLGLPGFSLGDISEIYGDSDVGKSSLIFHAAVQCQNQGIMPILIIKERKHRQARMEIMGFDPSNAVVNTSCVSLEDIFEFADKIISDVNKGKLPFDVCIFIDSLGNANCRAARTDEKDGTSAPKNVHQQNAKVMSEWMMLLSDKIGETRYETHPHYIGLVMTNHIYDKTIQIGPKMVSVPQPRGGKKRKYVASLEIFAKKVKNLFATCNGIKMSFGMISKISVTKNHINGIQQAGLYIITEDEIFANHKGAIEDYKARHKDKWAEAQISASVAEGATNEDLENDEEFDS
jgi:RecA/RadA recombinase